MASLRRELTLEELAKYLGDVGANLEHLNFGRPLKSVALYLAAQTRKNFDESHGPDGTPWPALKNPSRKRGGASAKPLRNLGLLMASYTGQAEGHAEEISDVALIWGTNLVSKTGYSYPIAHQEGRGHLPVREQIGITPDDERKIGTILLEGVEKQALGG